MIRRAANSPSALFFFAVAICCAAPLAASDPMATGAASSEAGSSANPSGAPTLAPVVAEPSITAPAAAVGQAAVPSGYITGSITGSPGVAYPVASLPTATTYYPNPYGATYVGSAAATLRPALVRIDDAGDLALKESITTTVAEVHPAPVEVAGPRGKKIVETTNEVQMRYRLETVETRFPRKFDVFKMDGTKLSEKEARQAMKEERAALVVSCPGELAKIMSPLGSKLYRDDVLVVYLRPLPPVMSPLGPMPGQTLQPMPVPFAQPVEGTLPAAPK